jgi:hypothetical protein
MSAGQLIMQGGGAGKTAIVKLQVFVLPELSVAVQVTEFVPAPKFEPVGGTQVTGTTPSQASSAVGVK